MLNIASDNSRKVHVHFNFDGAVVGAPVITSPPGATIEEDGDGRGFFAVSDDGFVGEVTIACEQGVPSGKTIRDTVVYSITAAPPPPPPDATSFGMTSDAPVAK